ncbi:glutathione S-transferase T3-like [Eutrema salsugineum]|uniref:glutathione S-transferase T3-like n=1 Tax=Eutrema salsugineum TaxID=72664 RepID=UPI000CED2B6F|nr:glutathione S-transferase T3-like [Eutrema salsugineum]
MDSTNPFPDSGFMEFLHSQQTPHAFEPVSPSICLGDAEDSVFGSQWEDGGSDGECRPKEAKKCSRKKWTPLEDLVLISAWLNTSKDPIVGNEQRLEAFWSRIATYYGSSKKLVGMEKRYPNNCKQRWSKINEALCKFAGCYASASAQRSSGQNEDDVMKLANQMYLNDTKKKFTLEHAWRELRNEQKWAPKEGNGVSKRRRREDGSSPSEAAHTHGGDEAERRPIGVKASKAKGKKHVTSGEGTTKPDYEAFEKAWDIRQKDLDSRNKLSNKRMLENLLARTDPLSEVEVVLKNKLIAEVLADG